MSAAAIIAIAVAVVVVLGALAFVTLARRSDVRGAGALSGETRRRDAAAREAAPDRRRSSSPPRRAARSRRQGEVARYGTALAAVAETGARPVVAARPRGARRQPAAVLQPGHGHADERRHRRVRRRRLRRLPLADGARAASASRSRRQARRHHRRHPHRRRASSTPRRPAPGSPSTRPTPCPKAEAVYADSILAGMEQGIVALYQKCPHLGCRVPQCVTSQWFECPCHGSQYNRVGEKKAGPAPRGMDRFPVTVAGNGDVTVDTGIASSPARRSAPTPPARRPRARTASPAEGSTDAMLA